MKLGFYLKTACDNLRKNYRFYVPQILTGAGLSACFYIVYTIKSDTRLSQMKGGSYLPTFMSVGVAVIALLSVILVLYTNSFLMRQRKREYGLYNVLGMEKKHIGQILFFETAVSASISILLGALLGLLFYKLCSLFICALFRTEIVLGFYFISLRTILPPMLFFAALYAVSFLLNRISIARMKPVDLLTSKNVGEKEPKVNVFLLIVGAVTLFSGYVIAFAVKEPLSALLLFFVAVFLVIIGTYCLFTAGSIFVLKFLKRRKNYYYNKKHFSSVSGLLYRMKQNAVGLASICILATGVLVMISSTVSLYSGMQDTLNKNYPHHLYLSCRYETDEGGLQSVPLDAMETMVREAAAEKGLEIAKSEKQDYLEVAYLFENNRFYTEGEREFVSDLLADTTFITAQTYEDLTGEELELSPNEIAVCITGSTVGTTQRPRGTVLLHGKEFSVKTDLPHFPISNAYAIVLSTGYGIVVSDDNVLRDLYLAQKEAYGSASSEMTERVAVIFSERDRAAAVGRELNRSLFGKLDAFLAERPESTVTYFPNLDTYWDAEESVIGMYSSLLFLGIILGTVCLFATVLIIYYKQISEGYEDRERYQIMKKVGMSDGEIKSTVRAQTLLVFFLPLVFAGIHTAFAFPMINRLLHLLMLSSTSLFIGCTVLTYAAFALLYVLIFALTARTYYRIVR